MELKRIGSSTQPPSTGGTERLRANGRVNEVIPVQEPVRARFNDSRAPQSFRPVAGFVAQYVDQHYPWPRSPSRKDARRQRATRAYIDADMLPDLLAETLRLRTVDDKF